ncbi:MAG: hypothetical protein AAB886_01150 [Patescibacteria group bacterium]
MNEAASFPEPLLELCVPLLRPHRTSVVCGFQDAHTLLEVKENVKKTQKTGKAGLLCCDFLYR